MITKLSHCSLFVSDQAKALDFYVNKLGFKEHTNIEMEDGMRWITLTTPDDPEQEIVLLGVPDAGMMGWDDESIKALTLLMEKQLLGAGVFYTLDCRKSYDELKQKGVDISEPKEQFYGTECILKDGCGNWFSMCTPKEGF